MNLYKKLTEEIAAKIAESLATETMVDAIKSTKAAEDNGAFNVVISNAIKDRQGETIDQNGWDLTNYKNNPVVLWAHNYSTLPVGVCDSIEVVNGELVAKGRFAPHAFAQDVRKLYEAGMLPATSVGFIVREMEGNKILKAELLEFSFVPVPANPAVRDLAKTLNLNLDEMITKGIFTKSEGEEIPEEVKESEAEIKPEETIETPVEVPEEKGAIADALNEQDQREIKWKNLDEVCEIINAFYDTYLDDNTPAESFSTLLAETAQLLADYAANPETDDMEGKMQKAKAQIKTSLFEKLMTRSSEKSGKVLSAKNAEIIKSAIDGMKAASVTLEELLTASEGDGESKSQEILPEAEKGSKTIIGQNELVEALKISNDSRQVLKLIATVVGKSLENFNRK